MTANFKVVQRGDKFEWAELRAEKEKIKIFCVEEEYFLSGFNIK